MRARRACLSVPASSMKFLTKAEGLVVDSLFFDLEDSVAPSQKEAARQHVIAALRERRFMAKSLGLRVNSLGSVWALRDLVEVLSAVGDKLDTIVVPKVESAEEIRFLDRLLGMIEREHSPSHRLGIEAQIETARGLARVHEIAAASARLENLTFGPADMAASLGLPTVSVGAPLPGYEGMDHFHAVLSRINAAAKAEGLQAIDGPYLMIKDLEGLRTAARRARALGFDGKWALHPDQIPVIQEVFTPSREECEKAEALLARYQAALGGEGRGAVMFGAEMIDEASRKQAEGIVAKFRASAGQ